MGAGGGLAQRFQPLEVSERRKPANHLHVRQGTPRWRGTGRRGTPTEEWVPDALARIKASASGNGRGCFITRGHSPA
jgi:hypothetical protein